MKKIINAPIKPHLLKFVKRDYHFNGVLEFDQQLCLFTHTNTYLVDSYFLNIQSDMTEISILMHFASKRKVYALIRHLEKQFKYKMCIYAEAHFNTSISIRRALKEFLEMYEICETEFRLATAYKNWQRYKLRENDKQNIVLWR